MPLIWNWDKHTSLSRHLLVNLVHPRIHGPLDSLRVTFQLHEHPGYLCRKCLEDVDADNTENGDPENDRQSFGKQVRKHFDGKHRADDQQGDNS